MKRGTIIIIGCLCISIIGCDGKQRKNNIRTFTPANQNQLSDFSNKNYSILKESGNHFNFRFATKKVTPCVIEIKSTYSLSDEYIFLHRLFFQREIGKILVRASGVIITKDGYIVTNNHIVDGAEEIEVTLQNKEIHKAKITGIDPKTDLAILKIEKTNLPYIEFGNSDSVEVGDWALAVGNPYYLTSTVTLGIISAKSRNINNTDGNGSMESYIQTDAVVNSGNSGGALVDYNGRLIGINSALESPTGTYAGYSFAIPSNVVAKVAHDILRYGKVKRGYLGAALKDMTGLESKKFKTNISDGAYIDSLFLGGAAHKAKLKTKDLIIAIDNYEVTNIAQIQEKIEMRYPGEDILLTLIRDGKLINVSVTLNASNGTFSEK